MGLDLYYCSLLNNYQPWLAPAREVLDQQELARYNSYSARKQAEFSLGRLMAKRALATRLGLPVKQLNFSYSQLGKPYLPGEACSFNISHCQSAVVVVVSDAPAGVDVEQIYRRQGQRAQPWHRAASFLNEPMAQMLDRLAGDDEATKARLFTQLWTCLEARVKMTGDSVFSLREKFNLDIQGNIYLPQCQASRACRFTSWQLQDNEIVSLACTASPSVKIWQWQGEQIQQMDVRPCASTPQF